MGGQFESVTVLGVKVNFGEVMKPEVLEKLFKYYSYNEKYYDLNEIKNHPKKFIDCLRDVWWKNLGYIQKEECRVDEELRDHIQDDWASDLVKQIVPYEDEEFYEDDANEQVFHCFLGYVLGSETSFETLEEKMQTVKEFCEEHLNKLGLKQREVELYADMYYRGC